VSRQVRAGLLPATVAALLAALCAAAGLRAGTEAARNPLDAIAVVAAMDVQLRAGPGRSYPPASTAPLQPGAELIIAERFGPWLSVRTDAGQSGWLRADSVARLCSDRDQ
jgi:uncharacterized protein YraI